MLRFCGTVLAKSVWLGRRSGFLGSCRRKALRFCPRDVSLFHETLCVHLSHRFRAPEVGLSRNWNERLEVGAIKLIGWPDLFPGGDVSTSHDRPRPSLDHIKNRLGAPLRR